MARYKPRFRISIKDLATGKKLTVELVVAQNTLFGRSVTVAGLLSGKCVYSALEGREKGDLIMLPPDILNADGILLDDMSVSALEIKLGGARLKVFDGYWSHVFSALQQNTRSA